MTCLVCGADQSEPHFGGRSCRACAAFFRRYFNSKKFVIRCVCKSKQANSHPCRSCRVAKCFAVGMTPAKLCGQRDPNGSSSRNHLLPMTYLPPKDTLNITSCLQNFSNFEKKRVNMFSSLQFQNVFEVTSLTKNDVFLTFELVSEVFPDFGKLSNHDKTSLINSFVLKLRQVQPALDHVATRVEYRRMEEEEMKNMMNGFFGGSFINGEEMEEAEIWRIFGPHWIYFYERVIEPIIALNLDKIKLMAVIWILFFDPAYINMSQKSVDLCWNIRKMIHRELKNYLLEKTENSESRFMDILEIPVIVERGEQKFLDEFLICEMNRIRVHDDFKDIVKAQRI